MPTAMRYDNVLITGASAGIGRALALACARPGAVLHLSSRHEARLSAVCFPMPGILEPDRAAAIILRGVAAGRRRVVFPRWMGLLTRSAGLLPPRILGVAVARAEKAAAE